MHFLNDRRIVIDYLGLLLSKLSGGIIPSRALLFGMVGASGLVIHLSVLYAILSFAPHEAYPLAVLIAGVTAMTTNYLINNEITYRDRRQHGFGLIVGYVKFAALCSIGMGTPDSIVMHDLFAGSPRKTYVRNGDARRKPRGASGPGQQGAKSATASPYQNFIRPPLDVPPM